MTYDKNSLINIRPTIGTVSTAGDQILPIEGSGDVILSLPFGTVKLHNVLYVPGLSENLISLIDLVEDGTTATWSKEDVTIHLTDGRTVVVPIDGKKKKATLSGWAATALSTSQLDTIDPHQTTLTPIPDISHTNAALLHASLGHPGTKQQRRMLKALKLVIPDGMTKAAEDCQTCPAGKSTAARLPSESSQPKSTIPLERVSADIFTQNAGKSPYRFALVAVDEATGFIHVRPLEHKGQAMQALIEFISFAERQTSRRLLRLRTDNDAVFRSNDAYDWQVRNGILWERTVPHNSRQNGAAERANRTLRERLHAALIGHNLPYSLWPEAFEYVALCLNLAPREGEEITAMQSFLGIDPSTLASFLRPFGCLASVFVPISKRVGGKGGPKCIPSIFIGADTSHKGWKFYSPNASPSTFWSNSAKFYPDLSWADRRKVANWKDLLDHSELFADSGNRVEDLTYNHIDALYEDQEEAIAHYHPDMARPGFREDQYEVTASGLVASTEPDPFLDDGDDVEWLPLTSAKALSATLNTSPTVADALSGDDRNHWKEAIRRELEGLDAMGTFRIVDRPEGVPLVDSKLVLKIKTENGVPVKYKARLVARGFRQRAGIDYDQTFAPVAPYTAIRAVLSLAASRKWHIHSTDFQQAYLNGRLEHTVYLKPPNGANVPPGKCYLVVGGLYGLCQSGRTWHLELDKLLRSIGLMPSSSAPCVYSSGADGTQCIVIAYVDDLIITSPDVSRLSSVKAQLKSKFKMEDKGELSRFCGIQFIYERDKGVLLMHQQDYVAKMVTDFGSGKLKRSTPMDSTPATESVITVSEEDHDRFRTIVGQATWLSINSRPDISFAVGVLQRQLTRATPAAVDAAVRIVDYLAGTMDRVIVLGSRPEQPLTGYTDANWASDPFANRRSTSGSAIFIAGGLVSWNTSLQKCVTLSAVEAELVAACSASRELLFFRHLLRELGFPYDATLLTDSLGCTQVASDAKQHWRLKHVDTRYHFLRDAVQSKDIKIQHTPGQLNPSDIFTKPVGRVVMQRHLVALGMTTQSG